MVPPWVGVRNGRITTPLLSTYLGKRLLIRLPKHGKQLLTQDG
jgi:hypothetical protein